MHTGRKCDPMAPAGPQPSGLAHQLLADVTVPLAAVLAIVAVVLADSDRAAEGACRPGGWEVMGLWRRGSSPLSGTK